jgi:hypothetical protein
MMRPTTERGRGGGNKTLRKVELIGLSCPFLLRRDLTMKDAIGYIRVSTREQGRSGLGLTAQRHDIESFGSREGLAVKNWY